MKKIISAVIVSAFILAGCTKNAEQEAVLTQSESHRMIVANGYGESREKAVEDAKNDALRQFGFNIVEINGRPELTYAGKIRNFDVVRDHSEPLQNGIWWEIKIQAEIEKL